MPTQKYAVVLADEALAMLAPFLEMFEMQSLTAGQPKTALVCETADFSGPMVELEVIGNGNRGTLKLYLHYSAVLFASDYAASKSIGFAPTKT